MKIDQLSPLERWMVKSNIERIRSGEMTLEMNLAVLKTNGYQRIAAAVEEEVMNER